MLHWCYVTLALCKQDYNRGAVINKGRSIGRKYARWDILLWSIITTTYLGTHLRDAAAEPIAHTNVFRASCEAYLSWKRWKGMCVLCRDMVHRPPIPAPRPPRRPRLFCRHALAALTAIPPPAPKSRILFPSRPIVVRSLLLLQNGTNTGSRLSSFSMSFPTYEPFSTLRPILFHWV